MNQITERLLTNFAYKNKSTVLSCSNFCYSIKWAFIFATLSSMDSEEIVDLERRSTIIGKEKGVNWPGVFNTI